jgi:hypothetical protein
MWIVPATAASDNLAGYCFTTMIAIRKW